MSIQKEMYERMVARQKQEAMIAGYQLNNGDIGPQDEVKPRSPVDREVMQLDSSINFLASVIETLETRLRPVMADIPVRTEDQDKLGQAMSPVTAAFHEAHLRVHRASVRLQDILERLEV